MVQDFEHRHDFSVLLKLKSMLFGEEKVTMFGEAPKSHEERIVDTMLGVVKRSRSEKERLRRLEEEREREQQREVEEQRQIQEAIQRSLQDVSGADTIEGGEGENTVEEEQK